MSACVCVYWLTGVGPAQGSNAKRVEQFEASNAVNAITLRPMEVGTLTEVLELVQQAQKLNWGIVVSGAGVAVAEGKRCVGKAPWLTMAVVVGWVVSCSLQHKVLVRQRMTGLLIWQWALVRDR